MASSPSHVPYQAYRSKRHSRTPSNQIQGLTPSSPPSRPSSALYTDSVRTTPPHLSTNVAANGHVSSSSSTLSEIAPWNRPKPALVVPASLTLVPHTPPAVPSKGEKPSHSSSMLTNGDSRTTLPTRMVNGRPSSIPSSPTTAAPPPQPSASTSKPVDSIPTRRTSTFRHVPLRNASAPSSPSPLRPTHSRVTSLTSRQLEPPLPLKDPPRSRHSVLGTGNGLANIPSHSISSTPSSQPQPPPKDVPSSLDVRPNEVERPPKPPFKSPSPKQTPPIITPATSPAPASTVLPRPGLLVPVSRTTSSTRTSAPYRPGFQPKGVYRPRTDEFLEARHASRDVGRVDRTRLERRLEKLINLHFGPESEKRVEVAAQPRRTKRMSSIFDVDVKELKNFDAGDLWKGVVSSQPAPGSKADIRSAEQSITPWEKDVDVSQCPLCSASFHPITNRKHHCRLCGKIICSLPVKRPQRPNTCSLLFVADPQTGKIEEVGEGVDYGVRKRTMSTPGKSQGKDNMNTEEKFLKGVRICRECRPVLLRQQYLSDVGQVPTFTKLYQLFIGLEKEIEEALPIFQELLLTLRDDRPTAEASAARKRLLEAFAQYDAIAKRIRRLPTPGPGSSQDRVQVAIVTRANVFLQKHMFPLQSLPKPKKTSSASSPASTPQEPPPIDPDSELAHALQPLLEQEALLETFVEEAQAHRKFEDAKTLKANLAEIRSEIDRIMANAPNGRS